MSKMSIPGFVKGVDTADWSLPTWALELRGLFEQAARGMYSLVDGRPEIEPRMQLESLYKWPG